ncbi:endoglucanase 10-like [Apium graveolens]|uniref:endoglucanase 10-like n=1 Tax=Apium graveolens TaxID=4045 RepID=UPI003D794F05
MESKKQRAELGWCWWLFVAVFAGLVVIAAFLTLWKDFHFFRSRNSRDHHGTVDKYVDALDIAMQFFDIQKSGKLENNGIEWRGDSGLYDGKEENLDLSKGMYDAGDTMKFGFPMAFTASVLSWGILEYEDHMKKARQLDHARDSLKWITDYLINAHPSENVLYIQVGDPGVDHACWERPEVMTERRPLTQVNESHPGTDIAAETAAAMASASLVFKKVDSSYSKLLLKHAQQLFIFADEYRGHYSKSVPQVQRFYNSSKYEDELLWAASWLYHATEDPMYLNYVTVRNGKAFANWGNPSWFSWDNKLAATQVLLSRVSFFGPEEIPDDEKLGLQMYSKTAEYVMCSILPDSPTKTTKITDGGMLWVDEWNALQYSIATAFLVVIYSDYMHTSKTPTLYCSGKLYNATDLRNFSISQAEYLLGNNPMSMSYLIGYGKNNPQYIHHRGSSIPVNATTGCTDGFMWLNSTDPNPNVAVGAMVGGPFFNETYIDSRNNSMQGEPTTYNSAFLVGLLSGLVTTSSVVKSLK